MDKYLNFYTRLSWRKYATFLIGPSNNQRRGHFRAKNGSFYERVEKLAPRMKISMYTLDNHTPNQNQLDERSAWQLCPRAAKPQALDVVFLSDQGQVAITKAVEWECARRTSGRCAASSSHHRTDLLFLCAVSVNKRFVWDRLEKRKQHEFFLI